MRPVRSFATQLKARTYVILETAAPGNRASQAVQSAILVLIVLNLAAMMLETVQSVYAQYQTLLRYFEAFSVAVFTIEYLLRLWSCTISQRYRSTVGGRLRFVLSPLALVDLLAIAPFYLPFISVNLIFLRSFRLIRLARVLKLGRYSAAVRSVGTALREKKDELAAIVFFMSILLFASSALMYEIEHTAQPDKFPSIPATLWWGVMTLTTVGYGDVYPVTAIGRILASVIAVAGIGLFALPTGVLGAAFLEQIQRTKRPPALCPHCGRAIDLQASSEPEPPPSAT